MSSQDRDFVALVVVSPKETILSSLFGVLSQPEILAKLGADGTTTISQTPFGGTFGLVGLPDDFPERVAEVVSGLSLPAEDVKQYLSTVYRRIEASILDNFVCTYLFAPGTEQRAAFLKEFTEKTAMLERLKKILGDTDVRGFGGENGWPGSGPGLGGFGGYGGFGGLGTGGPQPHG